MSSKVVLPFIEVDIADWEEKMYLFTISLLGTTIQDGGKKERSDDGCQNLVQWLYPLFLYSKF